MRIVRDIMQPDVIAVRPETTLRELVRILDEEEISGVPVVDSTGKVRGVVSRTDVVAAAARDSEVQVTEAFWESVPDEGDDPDSPDAYFLAPESAITFVPGLEVFRSPSLEDVRVEEIMTPVAFVVDPEMAIPELAQFLLRGRIHRAVVLEEDHLIGIVTAFDVLRVVAAEAEPTAEAAG